MKVCVFDPGLGDHDGTPSKNLGDLIIQDAVMRELRSLFPDASYLSFSTHKPLTREMVVQAKSCDRMIVGGSNLLSSAWSVRRPTNNQWQVALGEAIRLRDAVLLGAGWQGYQHKPELRTRIVLRLLLSYQRTHSVRDGYTLKQLQSAGFRRALNTSCITIWGLASRDLSALPTAKSDVALTMVTDYDRDPVADAAMLQALQGAYGRVYAWPQGTGDAEYLASLGFRGLFLERSLAALDQLLGETAHLDYVGTRLHGGVRCIQKGHRALVVAIDNRSKEISKDTGLPVVPRGETQRIAEWIAGSNALSLSLPCEAIEQWRREIVKP